MSLLYTYKVCNLEIETTVRLTTASAKLNGTKTALTGIPVNVTMKPLECRQDSRLVTIDTCGGGEYSASLWIDGDRSDGRNCTGFSKALTVFSSVGGRPSRVPTASPTALKVANIHPSISPTVKVNTTCSLSVR